MKPNHTTTKDWNGLTLGAKVFSPDAGFGIVDELNPGAGVLITPVRPDADEPSYHHPCSVERVTDEEFVDYTPAVTDRGRAFEVHR